MPVYQQDGTLTDGPVAPTDQSTDPLSELVFETRVLHETLRIWMAGQTNPDLGLSGGSLVESTSLTGVTRSVVTTTAASVSQVGGTYMVPIVSVPLPGRRYVLIQADEANTADLYFGGSNVTADSTAGSGGIQVHPGGFLELQLGAAAVLYVASTAVSQKLRVLEIA